MGFKKIRNWLWVILLLYGILFISKQQVLAANLTLQVTGTCNYDYADQVLKKVNAQRKKEGLESLVMDEELQQAAMLRAAECAVSFSHVRPNGTICSSASQKVWGENIAAGQTSPQQVMTSWMNSSGHRSNILNASYQSIGIGCFYQDGYLYWVQCFGTCEGEHAKQSGKKEQTFFIEADKQDVSLSADTASVTLKEKEEMTLKIRVSMPSTWGKNVLLDNDSVEWSSSDSKVATVKNGVVTGISAGTSTITADLQGKKVTIKVKVSNTKKVNLSKVSNVKLIAGKKKLTLTWKKGKEIDGYRIQIATAKSFKNADSYYVKAKTSKKVLKKFAGKKLKAKKRYYVRICAYVKQNNKKVYGKWTTVDKRVK